MAFQVHVLHIDFIDSTGYKHAIMKQAEALLVFSGATTGYSIDINYNAVTVATITEGVEWTNAATPAGNAELVYKVLNNLSMTNQVPITVEWERGSATVRLLAKMIGRGGTGITVTTFHPGAAEIDLTSLAAAETVVFDVGGTVGYGPITFTEGVDFTDAATLASAINLDATMGPLVTAQAIGEVLQVFDDGGYTSDADLLTFLGTLSDTVTGDSWHELNGGGAATQLTVVSGSLAVDGAISAALRDYTYDGRGPAGEVFQNWLNDNVPAIGGGAGERIDGSLKVKFVPIPEGTQVSVTWEEV